MRRVISMLCVFPLSLAAHAAPTQEIRELVDTLDDPSHTVRTSATAALLEARETFGFRDAALALTEPALSDESRARLTMVLYDRFERDPKGGLGVGFGPERLIGVEIRNVVEDPDSFPATALLEEGDVLLVCDGRLLRHSDDLRAHIISHAPGEMMSLIVERGDDKVMISATLGAYASLRGAAPVQWDVARRAIDLRLSRLGVELPNLDPLGARITREQWAAAAFPHDPERPARERVPAFPTVVHAGSGREAVSGSGVSTRSLVRAWSSREDADNFMRGDVIGELMLELTRVRSELFASELRLGILVDEQGEDDPQATELRGTIGELRNEAQWLATRLEELRADNP